jgi:hypothetical protein
VHRSDTTSHVMYVVLDTQERWHNCNKHGDNTIVTMSCELLMDAFQFVGISSHNIVPNGGGIFKL